MMRPARFNTSISGGGGLMFSALKCRNRFSASCIDRAKTSDDLDIVQGMGCGVNMLNDYAVNKGTCFRNWTKGML